MNTGSKRRDVDDLLRRALADDLPEEVAAGMRDGIERFRAEKAKAEHKAPAVRWAGAWLLRPGVLAVLSLLMLVAGIILQGAKSSSPLAERVAAIKTQYASLETPRR